MPLAKLKELYILRHGIAVDHGTPGYERDSDRPLTKEGIRKMEEIAHAMKRLEISFDVILSSPYVRARQTAEITAEGLDLKKNLKFSDHLTVEGDPEDLIAEIHKNYAQAESLLLVGHEPSLSTLISVLVANTDYSILALKKGGFCKMTMAGELRYKRCATMDWLLTPRQLIELA